MPSKASKLQAPGNGGGRTLFAAILCAALGVLMCRLRLQSDDNEEDDLEAFLLDRQGADRVEKSAVSGTSVCDRLAESFNKLSHEQWGFAYAANRQPIEECLKLPWALTPSSALLHEAAFRHNRRPVSGIIATRRPHRNGMAPPTGPFFENTSEAMLMNSARLIHDLDQFEYLLENGLVTPAQAQQIEESRIIYNAVLKEVNALHEASPHGPVAVVKMSDQARQALSTSATFGRAFHVPMLRSTGRPLISAKVRNARARLEDEYHRNKLVVIDGLLEADVLERLYKYFMEATIWYETKPWGYVGAYNDDGMTNELLLELQQELQATLPGILGGHLCKHFWSYKYQQGRDGVNAHGDDGAVNVNMWITPDDANLDPNSGGLVVYKQAAPPEWDFVALNQNTTKIRELLQQSDPPFDKTVVPIRQNRMVLFDSSLIHQTDKHHFKPGYRNRRINLVFLYGVRQRA